MTTIRASIPFKSPILAFKAPINTPNSLKLGVLHLWHYQAVLGSAYLAVLGRRSPKPLSAP